MNCVTYDRRSYSVLKIDSLKEPLFCRQHNSLIEPVFCYHPRLIIEGNRRMCLDEMEKSPKPIAGCAMPVSESMVIHTHSPTVHEHITFQKWGKFFKLKS